MQRGLVRVVQRMLFREFREGDPLQTILVFRTGRLGDFLNAVPALHLLRARLPHARIVFVTTVSSRAAMASITSSYADLDALPWLAFITPSPADRAVCFAMSGRSRGLSAMRTVLEDERPDAVFVLPYMAEPLAARLRKLAFFAAAGWKGPIFGFDALASRGSLQHRQYRLGLYEHAVYGPLRAIGECAAVGTVAEHEIVPDIAIPPEAQAWASTLLADTGVEACASQTMMVAIAPGASFPHKIWPLDRFLQLGQALLARYATPLLVVGGPGDTAAGHALSTGLGERCLDLTGKTSVTQLAALLARCRLLISNDSGVAHLASAVRCPVVTLTSALDFPGMWEPWNSRHSVARVRIDCEYCLSLTSCPLKTNACIRAVDPQEVLRLCVEKLDLPDPLPGHPADRIAW